MYIREKCYDIRELAKSNLHVHTSFSGCAKPEMRMKEMVRRAGELKLEVIAITDHFNDPSTPILEKNMCDRFVLENYRDGVETRFIFGAELSAVGVGKYLDSPEVNRALEYRLYSANHYHLDIWEQPEDKSARGYALHTLAVLTELILSRRADCIAHPCMGGYVKQLGDDAGSLTRAITDNELGDLMALARDNNVAWEINEGAALGFRDFSERFWNIGREVGVVFHFGTDAHSLQDMDTLKNIDELGKIFK